VVVDNDPDALELVALDLGLEGHEIVGTALDGETGLALVDEVLPDVLVVDQRMPPGPWGVEVAELVRRRHPDTIVVLYTNHRSPELEERTASAGARLVPKGNLRTLRRAVRS
jgi:two-component system response regulator YesN